jgi:hypothetical protein
MYLLLHIYIVNFMFIGACVAYIVKQVLVYYICMLYISMGYLYC